MRWPKYLLGAGLLLAVLWFFRSFWAPEWVAIYSHGLSACDRCRALRHEERWLGVPVTRIERTAYTHWFEARYPAHEHHWCWGGSTQIHHLDGGIVDACGRRHPLWELDPRGQQIFVEAVSAEESARFYGLMESSRREDQQEGLALVRAHFDLAVSPNPALERTPTAGNAGPASDAPRPQ